MQQSIRFRTVVGVAHLPKIVLICCKKCAHPCFTHLQFLCTSVFTHPFFSSHPFRLIHFWLWWMKNEKKKGWTLKKNINIAIFCAKFEKNFPGGLRPPDPSFKFCASLKSCTSVFAHFPKKCTSDGAHPMSKNRCATPTTVGSILLSIVWERA